MKIQVRHEDTSGGDVWGVQDNNKDPRASIVYQYDMAAGRHDILHPFRQLLRVYENTPVCRATFREMYWRLAAGYDEMMKGNFLALSLPVTGGESDFWEALLIESCRYGPPSKGGKPQLTIGFRLLGGKYAGLIFTQNITYFMWCRKIAKEIGFPMYQRTHYNELVRCCFVGHVMLEKWGDRLSARVSEFHVTSGVKSFNKLIRDGRDEECQYEGYTWPCYKCARGYADTGDVQCKHAVRPYALVKKECPQCGRETFFDLDSGSQICVSCQAAPFKRLEG
jgi:hypothetical protein